MPAKISSEDEALASELDLTVRKFTGHSGALPDFSSLIAAHTEKRLKTVEAENARLREQEQKLQEEADKLNGAADYAHKAALPKGFTAAIEIVKRVSEMPEFDLATVRARLNEQATALHREADEIKDDSDEYFCRAAAIDGLWIALAELDAAIAGYPVPQPGTLWEEAESRSRAHWLTAT